MPQLLLIRRLFIHPKVVLICLTNHPPYRPLLFCPTTIFTRSLYRPLVRSRHLKMIMGLHRCILLLTRRLSYIDCVAWEKKKKTKPEAKCFVCLNLSSKQFILETCRGVSFLLLHSISPPLFFLSELQTNQVFSPLSGFSLSSTWWSETGGFDILHNIGTPFFPVAEGNALLYTISNIIPSGVLWRNTSAVAAERMEVVGYWGLLLLQSYMLCASQSNAEQKTCGSSYFFVLFFFQSGWYCYCICVVVDIAWYDTQQQSETGRALD